jgi:hypothetical protein
MRFLDVMRPADTALAAYVAASDVRPGDDPAGVRRAFGERARRDRGLGRRTARPPDRPCVDGMLAGTTALLGATGIRRIADEGEPVAEVSDD